MFTRSSANAACGGLQPPSARAAAKGQTFISCTAPCPKALSTNRTPFHVRGTRRFSNLMSNSQSKCPLDVRLDMKVRIPVARSDGVGIPVTALRLRDAELLLAPRPRRPIDPRDCSCRLESSAITLAFATTAFRSTAIWCSMLTGTVVFCLAASSSPMTGTPRLQPDNCCAAVQLAAVSW